MRNEPIRLRCQATLVGFITLMMWSTLAALTTLTGAIPPLQLTAITFAIGSSLAVIKWLLMRENPLPHFRLPLQVWALGVGGLFGYHALYFLALRIAPPVEASLINYLWPLFIVLFSALLPGESLKPRHAVGALMGFAGCALLATGGRFDFNLDYALGYGAALSCAIVWAGYSVLSRRFPAVRTDSVAGFCAVTSLFAFIGHVLFEETVWPSMPGQWMALAALGLGPAGLAFYLWDFGVKHGDIKMLGLLGYATPLFSTAWLLLLGVGRPSEAILFACLLIIFGAVAGARPNFKNKPR